MKVSSDKVKGTIDLEDMSKLIILAGIVKPAQDVYSRKVLKALSERPH